MRIRTFIIILVSVVVVLVGSAFSYYKLVIEPKYIQPFSAIESELANYKEVYGDAGSFSTAYVINEDMTYGSEITPDLFSEIKIPSVLAPYVSNNLYDLVSNEEGKKYWMVDVGANQLMSSNLVSSYEISDTARVFQINVDFLPVGLNVGESIDIRLSLPTGQDYIVMSQKHLDAIYGNRLIGVVMTEHDIALWNSILTDKSVYPGILVYVTKYVSGAQSAAQMWYPVNRAVLDSLVQDPNIDPNLHILENYDKLVANRAILDNLMSSAILSDLFMTNSTIGRSTWASAVEAGQQEYLRQQEMGGGW